MAKRTKPQVSRASAAILGIDQDDSLTSAQAQAVLERAAAELASTRSLIAKGAAHALNLNRRLQRMSDTLRLYAQQDSPIYKVPAPHALAQAVLIELELLLPPGMGYPPIHSAPPPVVEEEVDLSEPDPSVEEHVDDHALPF